MTALPAQRLRGPAIFGALPLFSGNGTLGRPLNSERIIELGALFPSEVLRDQRLLNSSRLRQFGLSYAGLTHPGLECHDY